MTGRDRRRRVVLLCCSFARNLAYYRAGQDKRWRALLSASHPQAWFWREANANFLDMCVLEWCKLSGDQKGEHHWRRVVFDTLRFEKCLLQSVAMDVGTFQTKIKEMRNYRNKFVAHLDQLNVMNIPTLDAPKAAVWFYHGHVATLEAKHGELAGLCADTTEKLTVGYEQCVKEASEIYAVHAHC